ncbi:hypothetical protein [Methylobacter sp. YRD-M1]|uniref:hypothetical protein n=1 Tax=Methylobacter sp. YRD-M1 TaxID=2911520 RepID=UPI00227A5568|nr:hypothetical protein [Methylobacter sp. YRD-M1]WAK04575.1 hypothetical protein LZ558_22550 [Methylobacter sp. YRD-M1]
MTIHSVVNHPSEIEKRIVHANEEIVIVIYPDGKKTLKNERSERDNNGKLER